MAPKAQQTATRPCQADLHEELGTMALETMIAKSQADKARASATALGESYHGLPKRMQILNSGQSSNGAQIGGAGQNAECSAWFDLDKQCPGGAVCRERSCSWRSRWRQSRQRTRRKS